jgi:hypothetical protein
MVFSAKNLATHARYAWARRRARTSRPHNWPGRWASLLSGTGPWPPAAAPARGLYQQLLPVVATRAAGRACASGNCVVVAAFYTGHMRDEARL